AKSAKKGYGMSYQEVKNDPSATARFSPGEDFLAGTYKLYTYFPKTPESAPSGKFTIFTGKSSLEKTINFKEVNIQGQTTSTWVEVGEYTFENGSKRPYVTISADSEGTLAANAMIWVPVSDQK